MIYLRGSAPCRVDSSRGASQGAGRPRLSTAVPVAGPVAGLSAWCARAESEGAGVLTGDG